jgi:DNA invertase Pin-like site-specific DNA recombinase
VSAKPSGRTQASINAEPAPRLPHERDESSDSQANGVRPVIQQAHDDLESGKVDTDRGPPMDEAYQRQKTNTKKSTRP